MIPSGNAIKVVLATDSFLLGDGLAAILKTVPDVTIVGRAKDHLRLARVVDQLRPDAVIYGIRTAVSTTMANIAVARHLRAQYPEMGFVVISDRANGFASSSYAEVPRESRTSSTRTFRILIPCSSA